MLARARVLGGLKMLKPSIVKTDWQRVINDIHNSGTSLQAIAKNLNVAKTTLIGWRAGATPNHHDGEALLTMWCYISRKSRSEVPVTVTKGSKQQVLLIGGRLDGRRVVMTERREELLIDKEIYLRRVISLGHASIEVYVAASLSECKSADLLTLLIAGYKGSFY